MPIVIFLIGITAETASPFSSSHAPMDHVFYGDCASNKLTAATLQAVNLTSLFLPRAGGRQPVTVF